MGLFSKILGGLLVVSLLASGVLYVRVLIKDRQLQTAITRAEVAESNLATAEAAVKLLKEYQYVEDAIQSAPSDAIADYLRSGVLPKDTKGDGVSTPTGGF
jgi:hypothetical protein